MARAEGMRRAISIYTGRRDRSLFLTDAEATRLRKTDPDASSLKYFDGRRRVEAALEANGGSVDAVFAGH